MPGEWRSLDGVRSCGRIAVKCSIAFATFNRGPIVDKVLESIRAQDVPFDYEIVICDDGSQDDTKAICKKWDVEKYHYLDRPYHAGPAAARNVAYRECAGDVVICQASDVVHVSPSCIERLCEFERRTMNIGICYNYDESGAIESQYCGYPMHCTPVPCPPQPFNPVFFLGSVKRRDLFGIGGDDEDFVLPNNEDNWFTLRLGCGRGLRINWRKDVWGHHLWHPRPKETHVDTYEPTWKLLEQKVKQATETGDWTAAGGPWPYKETA